MSRMRPGRRALFGIAVPLALAAASASLAADLAEVKARGALRVLAAHDENWFLVTGDGPPGFEREVLEGYARLHGLRFEVVPVVRWEEAIPMLLAGRGDLLAGINDTPERRRTIAFTEELLPARSVVVNLKPAAPVASPAALLATRVAVVPESTWAVAADRAGVPASALVKVADVPEALAALKTGRAGAAIVDVVDYLQQRRRIPELQLGLSLGGALSSAWGVRKADAELRRSLDAYLAEFRKHPGWSRLLVKYFGEDAPLVLGRQKLD
jgi:ABC-type amino acid transport substrate-binding protein